MEEDSVTVDGITRQLEQPFFVMATQNPIEYEGTYPLPEAQLDRFILKLKMGYPAFAEEIDLLEKTSLKHPIETIQAVMSNAELTMIQAEVDDVYVDRSIHTYIVNIVNGTREHPAIYLGVSPRG